MALQRLTGIALAPGAIILLLKSRGFEGLARLFIGAAVLNGLRNDTWFCLPVDRARAGADSADGNDGGGGD